jgi:hypothetical protein
MVANRYWHHFMGRGIVEPIDDLRTSNPASNPALLDALAALVVKSGFNLKALVREIMTSRVYQLSTTPNASNGKDSRNFARAQVRRLPAEVLLDAISQATAVPEKFDGIPLGTRAIQLWDNRQPSYFLDAFGRPLRATVCECERSEEPSVTQALHLMNSPAIQTKVAHPNGRVARLVAAGRSAEEMTTELYLAALSRLPVPDELKEARALFAARRDPQTAGEDLLWALLNSREFVFNH